MTYTQGTTVGPDEDAPVDATGQTKHERRDLQPYRLELATLMDGKIRRKDFPTGDIIEPEVDAKTGRVKNKNRIGRGTIEYDAYLGFDGAAKEDPEGRALRID